MNRKQVSIIGSIFTLVAALLIAIPVLSPAIHQPKVLLLGFAVIVAASILTGVVLWFSEKRRPN